MGNSSEKIVPDNEQYESRIVPGIGRIYDVPQGLDWVHPDIAVKDTETIGLGLVSLGPISKSNTVIYFGGKMMTWDEITKLPEDMWDIPYQITDDIFFGIPERAQIGVGEKINHSCNPNAGFASEMNLVAIRDIQPGEDITMDYATCSWMEGYRLECGCGSENCRGVVTGEDWKDPQLQSRLKEYFQPFLKKRLQQLSRGTTSMIPRLFASSASQLKLRKFANSKL